MKHRILPAIIALVAIVALACSLTGGLTDEEGPEATQPPPAESAGETGAPPEAATPPKPEEKAPPPKEETVSGSFTWDDLPIYPGAEEDKDALSLEGTSEEGVRMEWRHYKTTDSFDKVVEFYKSEMPEYDWEQVQWLELEPTTAGWSIERGIYAKNDWHDQASVEITDKAEGVVYIALMRSNDQQDVSSSGELPSAPPSPGGGGFSWDDMPTYPGADTDESAWVSISAGDGLQSETRPYWTDDSFDKVVDFYQSEMPKNGWDQVMWTKAGEMANGMYGKNDDQDIAQVVIADKGEQGIQIQLTRMHEAK